MRVVITGGCGFIGSALALHLIKTMNDLDELILVDTMQRHGRHTDINRFSDTRIKIIEADLADRNSFKAIPVPVDRVYHLSAVLGVSIVEKEPLMVMRNNTLSTMNVVDWFVSNSTREARFLFSSSSEIYSGFSLAGFDLSVPTSEEIPIVISDLKNPRFSYALTKIWGEAYCNYLAKDDAFTISVRYHNIYGPRMGCEHVIPQVLLRILSKENPFKIISAEQTRSFCWIDDAVKATHLVMESDKVEPGMVVHIGNEKSEIKIGELYELLFSICGWWPENVVNVPAPAGSVSRRCPDTEKLRRLTEYSPDTSISTGIEKTVDWYNKNLTNINQHVQQKG